MIVLISIGLSACKSNEKIQKKNIISVTPLENSFVSEQIEVPEDSENVFSVRYSRDNIFFNGYNPRNMGGNSIINIVNLETNQVSKISVDSEISGDVHHLSAEEYIYIEHDTENQSVFLIEKIDRKTGEHIISKEADYFDNVSDMFFDNNGNICLLTSRAAVSGNIAQVHIYSPDLELIDTIDLNINGQSPLKINEYADSYYLLSQSSNRIIQIYALKKDYSVKYSTEISDAAEIFCDSVISPDGDLLVFSSEENSGKLYVDIIDSNNGKPKSMIELNDISYSNICGSYEKYDFIYSDIDGVYGYIIDKETSEIIIKSDDADMTDFKSYCLNQNDLSFINYEYCNPLNTIYQSDLNGNIIDKYTIDFSDEGEIICDYCIDGNGRLGYVTSNVQTGIIKYYCIDEYGDCGEVILENYSLFESITTDQSGNVCIAATDSQNECSHLIVIDSGLNIVKDLKLNAEKIIGVCYSKDGNIYVSEVSSGKNIISLIDYNTGEKIKDIQADDYFPDNSEGKIINGSDEYDFYYFDMKSVYGYLSQTGEFKEILDTDIFEYDILDIYFDNADTMVCIGRDVTSSEEIEMLHIFLLKKSEKEITKKGKIRTAVIGKADNDIRSMVKKYNKTNTDYYIDIVEYDFSDMSDFNADVLNGKIPDILITGSYSDMTSWIKNDLTEDLNDYFRNDNDISLDQFSHNIVSSFESGGKVNFIFPSYKINGLIGKSSDVSDGIEWTVDEFISCMESDSKADFCNISSEELIEKIIMSNLYGFIDFEKNECCFDNQSFISYLDYIKKISDYTDEKYDYPFRDNNTTLDFIDIGGFTDFNLMEKGEIGETSSLKGAPGIYESCVTIEPSYMISICKKSELKSQSWEFIKLFLTDEYQDSLTESQKYFPIKISSFNFLKQKQTATDSVSYYYYKDEEVPIYGISDETSERIVSIIESAKRIKTDDEKINEIIFEEINDLLYGSLKSSEVSKKLQNRISLYLSECK
ncbi:MAG: extracellular solute-binding protein [Oscillospiraceae bacterium]|nr:extracellular solute-binding protein [Oscillospiraceae bacterium]